MATMTTLLSSLFLQITLSVAVALWLAHRSTMKRLDEICRCLDRIEAHVDSIGGILDRIDGSVTRMEGHMDAMDRVLDETDGTLTRLEERTPPLIRSQGLNGRTKN
jgi:hypothetical protein